MKTRARLFGVRRLPLRDSYDAVIVGGGVQGLALAYHLAKEGYANVAVLDKSYLGSGASGRNSSMIRDVFATPEWARFFGLSLRLWESISDELDYNVMFTQRGTLMVAFREETLEFFRRAVIVHREMGVKSRYLDRYEVRQLAPEIGDGVQGGLLGLSGGMARHDGLVWGYAVAADRLGVEIHSFTEVTGIDVRDDEVVGVRTSRGPIRTRRVVHAAGGHGVEVGRMAGVELPIETLTLEKFVTEAVKPMLTPVLVSVELRCSIGQTSRGEFVMGSSETSGAVGLRSTYDFLKISARKLTRVYPPLARTTILRQWGGMIDVTPDHAPIVGEVDEVKGFFLNSGWGGYGFMAAPAAGKLLAPWFLRGERSAILEPFQLGRFKAGRLVPDAMIPIHQSA